MAIQTQIQIQISERDGNYQPPPIEGAWLRRSYEKHVSTTLRVGQKPTPLKTSFTDIQFVYVNPIEGSGTISLFRNLSPDAIRFNGCFLLFDIEGLHSLSFSADTGDAELFVYVAGA
jgi:hypothetical protein